MAVTVIDLDAAFVIGQAQAQEWEAEFMADWNAPLIEAKAVQDYLSLPPEGRDVLKAMDPAMVKQLELRIRQLKRKMGAGLAYPDETEQGTEA